MRKGVLKRDGGGYGRRGGTGGVRERGPYADLSVPHDWTPFGFFWSVIVCILVVTASVPLTELESL